MENGARFCPHCGAMTSAAAGPASASGAPSAPNVPVFTMPGRGGDDPWSSAPEGGSKRRSAGLLIGGVAAAVLVLAGILVAIGGLFSSPKGQVEKALAKTAAAYADAKEAMGAAELSQLIQDKSYTQRASLELNSVNEQLTGWYDAAALEGIGMRMTAGYDQKSRKMDFDMAAYWDGGDLASFQMLVDGGRMTFSSPEFTKGAAYGFNTETLGAELVRLGAWDDSVDLEKIGFNFFDLADAATPDDAQVKEIEQTIASAYRELFDALEVEKGGKQSVQVNGKSTNATLYYVVIPEDAMKDYIDALEDAMKVMDAQDMMRNILQSMGFDKGAIQEILSEMDTTDVYGEMSALLKEVVTATGDLELDVYVSGGYVCAVEYSQRIQGGRLEINLYLGGGGNYVDDLSLELSAGDQKLTLESTGDHSGKSGVFTDKTTIRVGSERVTSELRWEPKAARNNFAWELSYGSTASIQMEGQLTTTKNSIDLQLDDLAVKAAGTKLFSLSAGYYVGPYEGVKVSHPSPTLLSDMDLDDLELLLYDIQDNAVDWADGLDEQISLLLGLDSQYSYPYYSY